MGADQRQVGGAARVGAGNFLQLAQRRFGPTASQLGHRECGACARVLRILLAGFGKVFLGLFRVTVLQIHLAGQQVAGRVHHCGLQQRLQDGQRFRRLPATQVGLHQCAPRPCSLGCQPHSFGQMRLSLHQGVGRQFDFAHQLQAAHVLRGLLQQRLAKTQRQLQVLLLVGQQGVVVLDRQAVGGCLAQLFQLLGHGLKIALADQGIEQGDMGFDKRRLELDGPGVGCQPRLLLLLAEEQQIALEFPRLMRCWRGCDDRLGVGQGTVEVTLRRLVACLDQPRRRIGRVGLQCRTQCVPRLFGQALRGKRGGQCGLQVGLRRRLGQRRAGKLVSQLAVLALRQQRLGQWRQHTVFGEFVTQCLAQLGLRTNGVPLAQQRHAQQIPRLGQCHVGLQRVLELDHRRLGVVLGQKLFRRCHQLVRLLATAGAQQQNQQHRCQRGERARR